MMDILMNPFFIGLLAGIIVFAILTYLDSQNNDNDEDNNDNNKENIILVSGIVAILVGFLKYYFFNQETNSEIPMDSVELITRPLDLPVDKIPVVFFKVDK